jgi:hypothetical protein
MPMGTQFRRYAAGWFALAAMATPGLALAESPMCHARYYPAAQFGVTPISENLRSVRKLFASARHCPANTWCTATDRYGVTYDFGFGRVSGKTLKAVPGVKLPLGLRAGDDREAVRRKLSAGGLPPLHEVGGQKAELDTDYCLRTRDGVRYLFMVTFDATGGLTAIGEAGMAAARD